MWAVRLLPAVLEYAVSGCAARAIVVGGFRLVGGRTWDLWAWLMCAGVRAGGCAGLRVDGRKEDSKQPAPLSRLSTGALGCTRPNRCLRVCARAGTRARVPGFVRILVRCGCACAARGRRLGSWGRLPGFAPPICTRWQSKPFSVPVYSVPVFCAQDHGKHAQ
eukprot:COSAG02_NODE_4160_length_5688_cov_5.621399_4_plen_163_part_00